MYKPWANAEELKAEEHKKLHSYSNLYKEKENDFYRDYLIQEITRCMHELNENYPNTIMKVYTEGIPTSWDGDCNEYIDVFDCNFSFACN